MTNNLHNIVVYIKDEAELQQAREILEANGEVISDTAFKIFANYEWLYYSETFNEWVIFFRVDSDIQITLTELEQKLKEKQDENTTAKS